MNDDFKMWKNQYNDFDKINKATHQNYLDWLEMNTANITTIDSQIVTKVTLSNGFIVEISFKQVKE
jgi:hypothetical protein